MAAMIAPSLTRAPSSTLELLDLGDAGVGWLTAAVGVGGVIGGAAAATLVTRPLERGARAFRW
jgi:hypothetical protein